MRLIVINKEMKLLLTFVSLLPIICGAFRELIFELNKYFNFDHNLFILDSSADINHFITINRRNEFTPKSLYVFNGATQRIAIRTMSKNTFMVVAPKCCDVEINSTLLQQVKRIQRFQTTMKIGLFFHQAVSTEKLRKWFEWCRGNLIVNIFAATYSNVTIEPEHDLLLNIFTFDPFGPFSVINVTDSKTLNNLFPSLKSNFRGHELRLGYELKWITNIELWTLVFKMMNASYTLAEHNFTILYDEHFDFAIDILPRYFSQNRPNDLYIYPLKTEPQIIVVPEALPYSEFSVYLQTVTNDKFFGFSLITIAVVMLLLTGFRYIKQKEFLLFKSVADVLNLLMNDNGYIKYQRLTSVEALLIVPLTFVGAIIVNGILSNLQSYLTRPVIQPQINTLDDIYHSMLPIITWTDGWKTELVRVLTNTTSHFNWEEKVIVLPEPLYNKQVGNFNRSGTFLVGLSTAKLLFYHQKRIGVKGYHNPNIRISNFFVSYKLSVRFLFFERLNDIIQRIHSAGLYQLWTRADNANMAKFIEVVPEVDDIDRFPIPMVIVYGWIASAIILLLEIIWKKFNLLDRMRFT